MLHQAFREQLSRKELSLASSINEARASSISLKLALNIRMLLYFCDHMVGKNQGILTPKLERLLGLSRKKRIVSLIMSQVLLTIETLLWSLMTKFKHCAAQCTNIAGGYFLRMGF